MKYYFKILISLAVFISTFSFANLDAPVDMLNSMSKKVLAGLEAQQNNLTDNYIHQLIDTEVVPYVDINRMAGSVLGRNYWTQATSAQRDEFIQQFKKLVISTYSAAMASYDDDRIEFYPLRGGYANKTALQVQSILIRKNGQRVSINYNLTRAGDSWKIYDFVIENISMVQSYRSQFAATLSQGGLPALLTKLKQHNQR